jgi:alkylated DNA nucleotide flippase Atl1
VKAGQAKAGQAKAGQAKAGQAKAGPDLPDFASRVLDVADAIPPGQVMTYGDVAEYLGQGGPRQVGRVMALWGGGVAWWRIVHADGSLLRGREREAMARYIAEGTPLRSGPGGKPDRLHMRAARWAGHR